MTIGNYHTHTRYCDGKGDPDEYAEAAIAKGMPRLGFSGHNCLPFPTDWTMPADNLAPYLRETRATRDRYKGRLEVFVGLEVDWIPGVASPASPEIRGLGLDFVVGSVHYAAAVDGARWTVDGPREELDAGLAAAFGGDMRALVERYYALVAEMALESRPGIIGHFDIVKKNNRDGRLFSEDAAWYRAAVRGALEAVAAAGSVMEINTGGIVRRTSGVLYPSPWILSEARDLGIPVMVNADAHAPRDIDGHFTESLELLRGIGFRSQRQLTRAGWMDLPL